MRFYNETDYLFMAVIGLLGAIMLLVALAGLIG